MYISSLVFVITEMQNGSSPRDPVPGTSKNEPQPRTPLHEAAISGDDETLERLLRSGADRNSKDSLHGNTALHEAGKVSCIKLVFFLLIINGDYHYFCLFSMAWLQSLC